MKSITYKLAHFVASGIYAVCVSSSMPAEIGEELWSFQTGDAVFASPTLDSAGNIYFGSVDGKFYSIDAEGNERWSVQTGDWVESTAALSSDESVVYFGSWDNNLYALNTESGAQDWIFQTGSLIFSSPAVADDGTIFVGGADGLVYAISADGALQWSSFLGGELDSSIAISPSGHLYVGTTEGFIYALDIHTGEEIWSFEIPVEPGAIGRVTSIVSSCALDGSGKLYFGSSNYFVYALNTGDGTLAWNFETGAEVESSPTISIDGNVLISSQDGLLYSLSPEGSLVWSVDIGENYYAAAAVDEVGRIYVSSYISDTLSYLNLLSPDGAILQRIAFDNVIDSSVALSPDGRLYVGNNDGKLYAFSNGSRLSNSVWPKFRANLSGRGSIQGYTAPIPNKERIYNISARGTPAGGENDIIAGFSIIGGGEKSLLARAVGPGLEDFGVSDFLEDPIVRFYDGGGQFGANDDWNQSASAGVLASEMARLGAFALDEGSTNSADLLTLSQGVYTAIVSNNGSESGIALIEVYNADEDDSEASLSNVSMRGLVGTGDEVLIAGFVIEGNLPKRVLLRAIGSGLIDFGVTGALTDPTLRLFRDQSVIETNDDWDAHPEKNQLEAFMTSAGAFDLEEGSGDSALFAWLEPGLYTAIVAGKNDQTGIALVELYDLTGN